MLNMHTYQDFHPFYLASMVNQSFKGQGTVQNFASWHVGAVPALVVRHIHRQTLQSCISHVGSSCLLRLGHAGRLALRGTSTEGRGVGTGSAGTGLLNLEDVPGALLRCTGQPTFAVEEVVPCSRLRFGGLLCLVSHANHQQKEGQRATHCLQGEVQQRQADEPNATPAVSIAPRPMTFTWSSWIVRLNSTALNFDWKWWPQVPT